MPSGQRMYFFDDFQNGLPAWEPMAGDWDIKLTGSSKEYASIGRGYALSYAGNPNWSNYTVSAKVTIDDDRQGQVGIVGRGESDHYYFELVLGRDPQGHKAWAIRQRYNHRWTTLASGPYDYVLGAPYVMRLSFQDLDMQAAISRDGGRSFDKLGVADAAADGWRIGRFGVVTYGGGARFDDLGVSGEVTIALVDTAHGWGPVSLLRDNTTTFTNGKPSGGWYVTPIHVNLRPDGKVLVSGFSRKGASGCSGTTQRQNGMTWLLDPSVLDSASDGATLFTTPINEQNSDPVHDVMYCAGHSPMADGRTFFAAGTRYPDTLPDSNPERGVRYSRIFDGTNVVRVGTTAGAYHLTQGGQVAGPTLYPDPGSVGDGGAVRGEKWYPTTLLMPDGKILTFGGFHFSAASNAGSKANNSFEIFDTAAWDANHNTYPYTVLTQHTTSGISGDLPPTRGYSNMFLLPKPVPAGSAGGFARSVAIYGGVGRVALFNHEPGAFSPDTNRLFAGTNAMTVSPDGTNFPNERAEGGSGVLLSDGRIMVVNGGHTGDGAKRAYVYNPYTDTWLSPTGSACTTASCSLDMGVSRMYGQAVQLPDGSVMALNGYNGNPGGDGNPDVEDGNTTDISSPIGDVRRPVLVDPYANPMTATGQTAWPEITHRGYHSVSLLLKDGRILTGGGKDGTHATGCEKNELRIYTPPYLQGNPVRPQITNVTNNQLVQVGSGNLTINYTGTLKATRPVALMAMGALTHAFDMGQRYVPLTVVSGGGATGSVVVKAPSNINVAQPGFYNLFVINSAGVPSMGVTVQLTPPAACVYGVNGNANSYIEAELTSRRDGPFVNTTDATTSGGSYVDITQASGNQTSQPDEGKVMWYDVNVSNGGSFFVWALVNRPDTTSSTAWVSVNGDADQTLTTAAAVNTWSWVRLSATASTVNDGKNTIKVKVREDGLKIDKLVLTKTSAFTPAGIANTAQVCNGPAIPDAPAATPGNGQMTLSWGAVAGATSYTVRWGTTSGTYPNTKAVPSGTSTTVTGLTNGTTYFFVVSAQSGGLSKETSAAPTAAQGWTSQDIGAVAAAGSWSLANGVHTVVGNGADIWNAVDEFRFTYQTLNGDGNITARLTNFTGSGTVNANAKAGVMIRQDLTAGSPHLLSCLAPNGQTTAIKQIRRLTPNVASLSTSGAAPTFPRWVRVTRAGTSLSTWESTDGTNWTQVGTAQSIGTLGATTFVGLAVTSHVDGTNYTATFDNVTINPATPPNAPPTVATAAVASPAMVSGTTTALSVLGADDGGEAALTYTWSTTGTPPAAVTFSANGTNAAKNTTATFTKAGPYDFQVQIKDAANQTVTSTVTVTVNQAFTSVAVTPPSASVANGDPQQFAAAARDQFAIALAMQPTFTWTVTGGGTIDTNGVFTATTVGGPFTVTATSGAINGTALVTVTVPNQAPTVATAAAANPQMTLGTTSALSVLGADDGGEAALTYTWSTTGSPPAAVMFSANGTNAAKNTVATFSKTGDYNFQVVIQDGGGLSVTSMVTVTVVPTTTSILVSPSTASVVNGTTQPFTATARDQFAATLDVQPGFTWMVSGGGTIDAGGLFTATTVGGPFTVTATGNSTTGTAQVTVTAANQAPTVATAAAANPQMTLGTTSALSVLGADDGGEAALTYTWSTTGSPPAAVTFSANGTNAAKNTVATFTKAGDYSFQVVIKDAGNLTVTSPVTVTVVATTTTILVTPNPASVVNGTTQDFIATARDQFATALMMQPSFTWMVSGGGTINSSGRFTATTVGGPFTVTATSNSVNGTAQVTVTSAGPTISNLVVNDTATTNPPAGTDLIANSTQWSIQTNLQAGNTAFGDRTYTVDSIGLAALVGKPWIRPAADSKNYTPTSPPLATFKLTGTTVYLIIDDRWATGTPALATWLPAGFTDTGSDVIIRQSATQTFPYSVYKKTGFTSGSTVTLPTIGGASAPCYLTVVE